LNNSGLFVESRQFNIPTYIWRPAGMSFAVIFSYRKLARYHIASRGKTANGSHNFSSQSW